MRLSSLEHAPEEVCDPGDLLLSQMLETVMSFVPASVALGLKVGERLTVERIIVLGAHEGDADAAAPLIQRLPDLEAMMTALPELAQPEAAGLEHSNAAMQVVALRTMIDTSREQGIEDALAGHLHAQLHDLQASA